MYRLFIKKCIEKYNDVKPRIITKGNPVTFERFNYLKELNNCTEIYSYKGISNAIAFYDKFIIDYKSSINFSELDIQSMKQLKVPFILINNILTLRFLNYKLNEPETIDLLIGYFYSTYKFFPQLYSYNITDKHILYYFNIIKPFEYTIDPTKNAFYSEMTNLKLSQKDFYIKFKHHIHHSKLKWIKDTTMVSDDTGNVVKAIHIPVKNNYILNCIFNNIYKYNSIITEEAKDAFIIMNETNKIQYIKMLMNNSSVTIPYFLNAESIYTIIYDDLKIKYGCKTFTQNYIDDFLINTQIKFTPNKHIEIVNKIKNLIKQGNYQKGKVDAICTYLNISKPTFNKIIQLYNLSKPYQTKKDKDDYTEYFKKNYSNEIPTILNIKKEKVYENNDGNLMEDVDNLHNNKRRKTSLEMFGETDEEFLRKL